MQQSQEDDPSPVAVSSVLLRFPTIPVHGTPTSWLSQSQLITMTSTHDDSCDDTSSSLGDSSYEFIDERSNASTDYEDQDALTESTTSSDEHGFDRIDMRAQSDQADQPSYGQGSAISSAHATLADSEHPPSEPELEDQSVSEHTNSNHPLDQYGVIQFDEPSVINLNSSRFSEVSHTLQIIDKHKQRNPFYNSILDRVPGQLALTIRQTMTPYGLTLEDGSYKILYVGRRDHRDQIVQKIGTALAASLKCSTPDSERFRPSKFNVVPISGFGETASPEVVLIDSSGLELNVEECHHASFARMEDGNDTLHLEMVDGTSVDSTWTGSSFTVSNDWKLPDIAIFCVADEDPPHLKQARQCAWSLVSRHAVKSIVISQTPRWDKVPREHFTLDYLTPHICLEAQKLTTGAAQLVRRYPIDLATFLNIDAGQMNRNLACLAVAHGSSRPGSQSFGHKKLKEERDNDQWSFRDWLESLISDSQKEGPKIAKRYEPMSSFAFILMTILPLLIVGIGFLAGFLGASKVSNSRVFPTTAVSTTPLATTASTALVSLTSASNLVASTASSTSVHLSTTKGLSSNTDIASFLLDAYMLAPNKSEQFKVHVLGDCHIVLRPPHWFSKMKKPPKLFFKVLHGEIELEHELATLFEGVYALQIPREDAYGLLNVSIWTDSKPKVNQSFEVDFGSSWLKVAGWKKATRALKESIRDDLKSVQTSLSTVYDQTKTGLSIFVQQQREQVKAQKAAEKAILRSHYKTAVKTKELIVAQTRDLARDLRERVHGDNAVIPQQIKASAEKFTKDLSLYTRNKTSMISKQARILARAATGVDVKALTQEFRDLRNKHLRETQKLALKTWWKIGGVPKQRRTKVKAKGKGGSHRRGNPSEGIRCGML